jgi:hypothetical protein
LARWNDPADRSDENDESGPQTVYTVGYEPTATPAHGRHVVAIRVELVAHAEPSVSSAAPGVNEPGAAEALAPTRSSAYALDASPTGNVQAWTDASARVAIAAYGRQSERPLPVQPQAAGRRVHVRA